MSLRFCVQRCWRTSAQCLQNMNMFSNVNKLILGRSPIFRRVLRLRQQVKRQVNSQTRDFCCQWTKVRFWGGRWWATKSRLPDNFFASLHLVIPNASKIFLHPFFSIYPRFSQTLAGILETKNWEQCFCSWVNRFCPLFRYHHTSQRKCENGACMMSSCNLLCMPILFEPSLGKTKELGVHMCASTLMRGLAPLLEGNGFSFRTCSLIHLCKNFLQLSSTHKKKFSSNCLRPEEIEKIKDWKDLRHLWHGFVQ